MPSPKERVQILILYGAARRVYARHFDERDAQTATLFWTGWHVAKTLRMPAPLDRLGLALERDPYEVLGSSPDIIRLRIVYRRNARGHIRS